jgi:hypothetical protein
LIKPELTFEQWINRNCWRSLWLLAASLVIIPIVVACTTKPLPPEPVRVVTMYAYTGEKLGEWKTRNHIWTRDNGSISFWDTDGNRITVMGVYKIGPETPND